MIEASHAGRCLLWVSAIVAITGCGKPLNEDECYQLLDHYTALLVREENPHIHAQEVLRKQTQARELATTDPSYDFKSCTDSVNREQFRCAMRAPTVNGVEKCLVL